MLLYISMLYYLILFLKIFFDPFMLSLIFLILMENV